MNISFKNNLKKIDNMTHISLFLEDNSENSIFMWHFLPYVGV